MGLIGLAVLLAGCPVPPPPPPNGVVDLGPLGIYGEAGGFGSLYANIFHAHFEPEHQVGASVVGVDEPNVRGSFYMKRLSPGSEAVLPTVGEYDLDADGWSAEVGV